MRVDADARQRHLGAGQDERGDRGEGGRGRVGGDLDRPAGKLRLTGDRDGAALVDLRDHDLGAEVAQHELAVVAGRRRLDHRGAAGRREPGQQDRRLDLGRGDRQPVAERARPRGAGHGQRQTAAVAGHEARAHLAQRRDHPAHGTGAQAGVAGQGRGHRVAGQQSHEQARAGARVAQVEDLLRRHQAADAAAPDPPGARALADDLGAQRGHGLGSAAHVLALEQTADSGFAHGQRADHQRPVRDRLVAGDSGAAGERLAGMGGERSHASKGPGAAALDGGSVSTISPPRDKAPRCAEIAARGGAFTF